jgi:hypothetical protein
MKKLKEAIKLWIPVWRAKKQREISKIEENLTRLRQSIDEGSLDTSKLDELSIWRKENQDGSQMKN